MDEGDGLGSSCTVFLKDIDNYIVDFRENGTNFSLLLLRVNEISGLKNSSADEIGRVVSQRISDRLITCINTFSSIYRLSSDHFATIVRENTSSSPLENLDKLHSELHRPVKVDLDEIYMKVSVGYVEMSMDVKNSKVLLTRAEAELSLAKTQAVTDVGFKCCWRDCSEKQQFDELKYALIHNELQIFGQPIVNMDANKVEVLEIQPYWKHKKYGEIGSLAIVELAEKNNYLFEVATYVVKQFVAFYLGRKYAFSNVCFSINLSLLKVVNIDLIKHVFYLIDKAGIKRSKLILEVEDTCLTLLYSDELVEYFLWLKQQGIRISIDDTRSGYTNLDRIRNLDIDVVKINKSFLASVDASPSKLGNFLSLIHSCDRRDLIVVIEGVDNIKQKEMILGIKVKGLLVKGCLSGRPIYLSASENNINYLNVHYA
ncbi:MAG: GGDEF domain-containing protein [Oleispira sp.]|nr:GGDEF domain-containing protein [Oleispira sp.]MBL4879887.1 GGDEF domain-containing protein [Oleispira sp.]